MSLTISLRAEDDADGEERFNCYLVADGHDVGIVYSMAPVPDIEDSMSLLEYLSPRGGPKPTFEREFWRKLGELMPRTITSVRGPVMEGLGEGNALVERFKWVVEGATGKGLFSC